MGGMSPSHRAALARSTWQRLRRVLTAAVFVTATVAGISVGLGGASISPVAPAAAATPTATTPAASTPGARQPPSDVHHGDPGRSHLGRS